MCGALSSCLVFPWRVLGSPAVPSGSSHPSWPASLPLSTKSPSWSKCQTAPAPHSHSSWRVQSRDVSPWHLCCSARRGAGNVGSIREPRPFTGTGGFQQPQALRPSSSSSCSSEFQLCSSAEGRRTSREIFWITQAPLPMAQLLAPRQSRVGISGCFPKESLCREASPCHWHCWISSQTPLCPFWEALKAQP